MTTITRFNSPEITIRNGAVQRAAHVVAYVGDEKFRLCLTVDEQGWTWSPGPPAGVSVPAELTEAINNAVSSAVAQHGIAPIE